VLTPLRPGLSDQAALRASRLSMVVFAGVAVWLTVGATASLVEIGLSAYAAIGMLAPGVFLAFLWPRANAIGVAAGMAAGYVVLLAPAAQTLFGALFPEWEKGLVAMGVNAIVAVLVILITSAREKTAQPQPVAG